jgi:hypothetical protein
MAVASNGYRAALVKHLLTPGLISSSSGTAGLPPFISFSTSYRELRPPEDPAGVRSAAERFLGALDDLDWEPFRTSWASEPRVRQVHRQGQVESSAGWQVTLIMQLTAHRVAAEPARSAKGSVNDR